MISSFILKLEITNVWARYLVAENRESGYDIDTVMIDRNKFDRLKTILEKRHKIEIDIDDYDNLIFKSHRER